MASRKGKKDRIPKRLFKREGVPASYKREPGPRLPPGVELVIDPPGHERMSEVLEGFVEPYREFAPSEDAYRKLLMLALVAWNAAILPEGQRQALIDETLGVGLPGATEEDSADARRLIEDLIRRKLDHFAANKRMILSFELTDRGHDFHLSVMSTL